MSADDTPPRVWWDRETPGWLLVDRGEGRNADVEVWRPTYQHAGRGLPDGAVELHPAPAPVDADRLARALHDADCGCDDYDEVEDPRYITAVRAAHTAVATSPPSPAEVASRLSAAAEVCEKAQHHGLAWEFSQIASQLDEDGYSDEVCAAVAAALSGEATPDART